MLLLGNTHIAQFQSTPSVGRATTKAADLEKLDNISIHALRGEGDADSRRHAALSFHFNTRPPWGGRRFFRSNPQHRSLFQSTPSVGRATWLCQRGQANRLYFTPRPPWGGRLVAVLHKISKQAISIHALRGEGDQKRNTSRCSARTFQSTPSVGRATTIYSNKSDKSIEISIHALRGEGDILMTEKTFSKIISIHALRGEGDKIYLNFHS